MTNFYDKYTQAYVSVDCIIFGFDKGKLKILLGKRNIDPGRGTWSLYGGFVAPTETLDEAAKRVLTELTGIKDIYMRQTGAYSAIDRDPASRVISVAYYALINVKDYEEDLRKQYNLEWVSLNEIPQLFSDHKEMVDDALLLLQKRITVEPICFPLLPELFTLTQFQNVYEAITEKKVDKRNFRKKIKVSGILTETDKIDKTTSKRGAILYRLNNDIDDFQF